ncbi:chromosomal replication initiator protein DnaA [Nocardioides sp. GY 10113]|uniref:chromosomal replication initiator protein DnaA n=1 Tax=Nocardioides sp. GY 10113 TaxID=2569761 RepID=UPI0010A92BFF|nr:chromosomal replication initiator protein DnaA [Nocardioides sp. GY 10113]TIC88991.1 chromosomal replication initiator protein DnaA [Nocardioides sp. GY 10113]
MTGTPEGHEGEDQRTATPDERLAVEWRLLVNDLQANQRAWLQLSKPVTLHGTTAIVAVPDDFTRRRLEDRLRGQLEDSLSDRFGHEVQIAVTVDPSLQLDPGPAADGFGAAPETAASEPLAPPVDPTPPAYDDLSTSRRGDMSMPSMSPISEMPAIGYDPTEPPPPAVAMPTAAPAATVTGESRLNPKYTFETFVIGSSNRFPHAAAVAVSEAPGRSYNPLLVYGESGLGKTHLLHAIGHYVRTIYAGSKVRYVSSEEFTNEFINAIRDDRQDRFKRKYRDIDVLLIDDIQFLEGKTQTQEEFFHTFNTLHNANKQIVLTSDRPPKRLEALEDRLRNRFEWGLITDVQPPDLETRIAILRKKAAMDRLTAPSDVLEFIASKIQTNIRELEGALIRVTAFANLNRQEVDMTLAEIVLKDLIPEGGEPEITAPLIIAQTAAYFGLSIEELTGPSRGRHLVMARQIAMYLCRELTGLSLPKIGAQFGNRDHTTVMYAERKINQLLGERRAVFNQVSELTNRVKMQARQG